MVSEGVLRWSAVLTFACLVSIGYICQAWAFRSNQLVGGRDVLQVAAVIFNPIFLTGLVLSFGGTLARLVMFDRLGISQTVLAQELSMVLMLGLSLWVFRETLTVSQVTGSLLVLGGVVLIAK